MKQEHYFFAEPIEHDVDEKGRFNIPAVHRRTLRKIDRGYSKQGFYLSSSNNDFVRAFPQSYVKKERLKYLKFSSGNKERVAFFSSKISYIDVQGRVNLPNQFMGLERLVCVANGEFLDIWKPDAFKRYMESA